MKRLRYEIRMLMGELCMDLAFWLMPSGDEKTTYACALLACVNQIQRHRNDAYEQIPGRIATPFSRT